MTAVEYTHVEDTRPLKMAKVANPKGYWDLFVNKSKNGKAIRLSTRNGSDAVNIAVERVDDLIKALKDISARGAKTSVEALPYRS